MPRNMPMCQGQLNSTDFKSLAPSAGVYGGAGGPAPNCAFATTVTTIAAPAASATRAEVEPFLKAMVVPPISTMLLLVGLEFDRLVVRQRNAAHESQRLAVASREIRDLDDVARHNRVRP